MSRHDHCLESKIPADLEWNQKFGFAPKVNTCLNVHSRPKHDGASQSLKNKEKIWKTEKRSVECFQFRVAYSLYTVKQFCSVAIDLKKAFKPNKNC